MIIFNANYTLLCTRDLFAKYNLIYIMLVYIFVRQQRRNGKILTGRKCHVEVLVLYNNFVFN